LIYHSSGFLAANRPMPKVKCIIFVDIFWVVFIFLGHLQFAHPPHNHPISNRNPFARIQIGGRHGLVAIASPFEIKPSGTPLRPVFVPSSDANCERAFRMPRVSISVLCRLTRRGAPSTVGRDCSILLLDTLRIHFVLVIILFFEDTVLDGASPIFR